MKVLNFLVAGASSLEILEMNSLVVLRFVFEFLNETVMLDIKG